MCSACDPKQNNGATSEAGDCADCGGWGYVDGTPCGACACTGRCPHCDEEA
jgi:hypothetical protein